VAQAGQEIHGPGGFVLRLVRTAAETGGDLLEMEATYGGDAALPPEHLHPRQDERFEVLEGAVRTVVGGVERRYDAGETFAVPAGTPHQMTGDGPARVRWEVRPALRTAEFFERLYGSGPDSARAAPDPLAFLAEFGDEIRLTGAPAR
jgi:mannose-6-phosphate isomerase-like protein (cupin superfamily)